MTLGQGPAAEPAPAQAGVYTFARGVVTTSPCPLPARNKSRSILALLADQ
jgi:hypothetical protein